MKKLFALIVFSIFFISFISAVTCPYGEVNDTYPGDCGLYTDTNKDSVCDYSQYVAPVAVSTENLTDLITGKELKIKTVQEAAELYKINSQTLTEKLSESIGSEVKTTDSFQLLHDNYGLSPDSAKEIFTAIKTGTPITKIDVKEGTKEYYMWQITIITTILYSFSFYLVKKNRITLIKHKKIWNMLLLVSGIITALTSLFLLARLNYGFTITFPLNILNLHVIIGYITLLIALFHTLWHIPYYKSYFQRLNKNQSHKFF